MTDPQPTISRYQLLQVLGHGGMGEVHLASAQGAAGFQKMVALKVLGAKHVGDRHRLHSLLREAMIGVRLDHQHVVQVLDFGEDDGRYFIAMEYVRGFSLSDVIEHSVAHGPPVPLQSAIHVGRALANALDYVHGVTDAGGAPLGLIHGDVSPGNVLLGIDGRIKLSDFGVAALEREVEGATVVAGKLPYLPPEAVEGAPRSQAWDVYGLGALLYEAIAGARAFPGEGMAAVCAAMERGPRPLVDARPDCSEPVAAVIATALARSPAERFATAAELRDALDAAWPRRVDDADVHRAYVEGVYGHDRFVARHGTLPTTGGFRTTLDLAPLIDVRPAFDTDTEVGIPKPTRSLRFGLSPALGPDLARAYGGRLSAYLAARLDRSVRTIMLGDYKALVESIGSGEIDIAWMPPVAFAAAADLAAGALVVAKRHGREAYTSALFVAAGSPIRELADLRGTSVGWVDESSASGYLFAAAEIVRALGPLEAALGKQHFFGSHRDVCQAVANGWADAGATYAHRDERGTVVASGWADVLGDPDAMRPIAFSALIPGDNIAHCPQLPAAQRRAIAAAFRGMADDPEGRALLADVFHADSFVPADLVLYDRVRARLRLL